MAQIRVRVGSEHMLFPYLSEVVLLSSISSKLLSNVALGLKGEKGGRERKRESEKERTCEEWEGRCAHTTLTPSTMSLFFLRKTWYEITDTLTVHQRRGDGEGSLPW